MKIQGSNPMVAFLIGCLFFSSFCNAQSFYRDGNLRTNSIMVGVGPSFMYADNGGIFNESNFNWNPAISLAFNKKVHHRIALQVTGGMQFVQSGGRVRDYAMKSWDDAGSAFRFKGQAYFADLMPIFYVIPYDNHMNRGKFNTYFGSGIGVVHVNRKEAFSFDPGAPEFAAQATTPYVPVLVGFSYSLGQFSDLALEIKGLFTFSDELDGNVGYNLFNDHLFQTQIVYKRLLRSSY
jgi:hypothetical protein